MSIGPERGHRILGRGLPRGDQSAYICQHDAKHDQHRRAGRREYGVDAVGLGEGVYQHVARHEQQQRHAYAYKARAQADDERLGVEHLRDVPL